MQWAWGLDANHDGEATPTDTRMRQATVNILADLGAQPATLQPGLVAASASSDGTPPTSAINPVPAAHVNQPVTISGTAAGARAPPRRREAASSAPSRSRPTAVRRGPPRTVGSSGPTRGRRPPRAP